MSTEIEKPDEELHTLSAYVANKPGVLARIAQMFSRRGFNIDSLSVSSGVDGDFSRMTLSVRGKPGGLDQIISQMNKLVDVIHCFDHTYQNAVVCELVMVKVAVTPNERTEALEIANHFKANSVDLTETSIILMGQGSSRKMDAMIEMLSKFRIIETVRTGKVVMTRGDQIT